MCGGVAQKGFLFPGKIFFNFPQIFRWEISKVFFPMFLISVGKIKTTLALSERENLETLCTSEHKMCIKVYDDLYTCVTVIMMMGDGNDDVEQHNAWQISTNIRFVVYIKNFKKIKIVGLTHASREVLVKKIKTYFFFFVEKYKLYLKNTCGIICGCV